MEEAALSAAAAETSDPRVRKGHMNPSLLEVQSEQLAMKLQQEAHKDSAANSHKNPAIRNTDTAVGGGTHGDFEPSASAAAAHDLPLFQQQPIQYPAPASQGVWGTPGRASAADFLRSSTAAASAGAPQPSAPTSSQLAAAALAAGGGGGGDGASSAAASLVAVPLSAESVGGMVGMGIEQEWAAAALRRCGGADVSRAVEFCFSNDMKALAEEDARTLEADTDSDLAFAVALDQEERRVFEARRSAAAATLATERGTFGSKVRVAVAPAAAARTFSTATSSSGGGAGAGAGTDSSSRGPEQPRPQRWGVAEAEAMMDGDAELFSTEDQGFYDVDGDGGGDDGDAVEEDGDEGGGGFRAIPGGGRRKGKMPLFKNAEGEVVSKHDAVICGRMNARDASNLEGVGDLTVAGVRLGNRTFNSLKRDIRKKKEKGMSAGGRVEGATRSTQEGVMDSRTRLLVFKMVNAGTLLEVHGMVKTGKEAHVYHALAYEDPEALTGTRGVALKIFKTTLSEFGNRAAYVDGDPRYGNMKFNKQSRQKMFGIWAKKEHRNLLRLHRAGVPCPEPIKQREHTLVLAFIGKYHWPAPQLREIDLSKGNWRRCYAQVLELARMMFKKCHLVHADLSEYNVLYHEKVCHVIDVGQAVDIGHPKAVEFLRRDLSVISSFFRRKDVKACLADDLAERFVVGYPGPFSSSYGGESEGVADRGEEMPIAGVELVLELMGAPPDEVDANLRAACAAAEPWAARAAAAAKQAAHNGESDLSDNDTDSDIDGSVVADEDELGYATKEEGREGPGDDGDGDRNFEGKSTGVEAEEEQEEEEGWTVVDAEDEDDGEDGKGRGEKVELSERERTRTAAAKEALKAGIF